MSELLDIQGLRVHFDTLDGPVEALHSVSLSVKEGQIMGVVGESGCGKSVTSLVTIGLATCDVDEGSIKFEGNELIQKTPQNIQKILYVLKYSSSFFTIGLILSLFWTFFEPIKGLQASAIMLTGFSICFVSARILDSPRNRHEKFMRSIRGNKISMIFQEPMTALNPLYTVEKQVAEVLKQHNRLVDTEINKAIKFGKSIISPAEMLVRFLRNDLKGVLPLISLFVLILIFHQTNNSSVVLGLIANKYAVMVIASAFLWLVFSTLFVERNEEARSLFNKSTGAEDTLITIGYMGIIRLIDDFTRNNYALIVVSWLVIIILLWIPFGVLMTIIFSVAILAIPPIQISNYFNLDPAHTRQVVRILKEVRIPNPEAVVKMYPHELSGGMRQRVMIAMMMACEPKLLIADEPTTALDVTIQAQILNLMKDLRDREGTAIMMITHDLGVIAETCDAVTVMYAGSVVETGSLKQVLGSPRMPYTIGLLHSIPRIKEAGEERVDLPIIPGQVPDPNEKFDGCRFHPRCPFADDLCRTKPPQMHEVAPGHFAACHHTEVTDNLVVAQEAFSSEGFLQSGVNVQ